MKPCEPNCGHAIVDENDRLHTALCGQPTLGRWLCASAFSTEPRICTCQSGRILSDRPASFSKTQASTKEKNLRDSRTKNKERVLQLATTCQQKFRMSIASLHFLLHVGRDSSFPFRVKSISDRRHNSSTEANTFRCRASSPAPSSSSWKTFLCTFGSKRF